MDRELAPAISAIEAALPTITSEERAAAILELQDLMGQLEGMELYGKLANYKPTPKQFEFHAAGKEFRQVLLMAGNQSGKTYAAAMEVAMHMTGRYSDWWPGRRFNKPTQWWAMGVTGEQTRDNAQRLLLGSGRQWGTGTIPADTLIGLPVFARGSVADLVDYISVRHISGGTSTLWYKFASKEREKIQGPTLDGVWGDEEMPVDFYTESLTRLNLRRGLFLMTFTPLRGMTQLVKQFLQPEEEDRGTHLRTVVRMTLDDATFYDEDAKADVIAQYTHAEAEARVRGLPAIGQGLIWPFSRDTYYMNAFEIPTHFFRIKGMDFGIGHPTAAIWLAWNADTDHYFVYHEYKKADALISTHASALDSVDSWVPTSWPHDMEDRNPSSGDKYALEYENEGVDMLELSARYDDERGGAQPREPVILKIYKAMEDGRFHIFRNCVKLPEEIDTYHRKDGKIVMINDDLCSALRYAFMMIQRYGVQNIQAYRWTQMAEAPSNYDPLAEYAM
jgi:phage terminase large subunit-like protein